VTLQLEPHAVCFSFTLLKPGLHVSSSLFPRVLERLLSIMLMPLHVLLRSQPLPLQFPRHLSHARG
jgi:hypothetical protein